MPAAAGHHGRIVSPILPGAPLANDLHVAAGETFNELDVIVLERWRLEDLAHLFRGCGRDELPLFEHDEEAQDLAHCGCVGVVRDGAAIALGSLAVMFADPDATAALSVVKSVLLRED